jgi:hypothetical protein
MAARYVAFVTSLSLPLDIRRVLQSRNANIRAAKRDLSGHSNQRPVHHNATLSYQEKHNGLSPRPQV